MRIEHLRAEHVKAVAALHVATLTGLLRALGTPAARAYYRGCVASPRTIAYVALDGDDRVCGFVCGSMTPRVLRIEALARNPLAVTAAVALGVVMHPSAIRYLLEVARGSVGAQVTDAPELTYLAIAPEHQGAGIGKQLVHIFSTALRRAGARSYELSVDDDNLGAGAFYKRLGFHRSGHYREFGVNRHRYTFDLGTTSR